MKLCLRIMVPMMILALANGCTASSGNDGTANVDTMAAMTGNIVMAEHETPPPVSLPERKTPSVHTPLSSAAKQEAVRAGNDQTPIVPASEEGASYNNVVPDVDYAEAQTYQPPQDLPPQDAPPNSTTFPREVTTFMVDRDGCDHFRGEEPYDAERRAYLEESIRELCKGSDARLAQLRKRYGGDPNVIAALSRYEDHIELPSNE